MSVTLAPLNVILVDRHMPLASISVPAGFPSPAGDDLEDSVDPIKWVVRHERSTFWWRVSGDSLEEKLAKRNGHWFLDPRARGDGYKSIAVTETTEI